MRRLGRRNVAAGLAAMAAAPAWSRRARAQNASVEVDLELVLAVDVSRSVDDQEFELQRRGYARAFTHPTVIRAIQANPLRKIAVAFVEWSGAEFQKTVVPWTEIADAESGALFADRVLEAPRSFWGWTSISGAIDHSVGMFGQAYRGRRKVIDVSGDGINNSGRPAYAARDDAVARGVAINGLVIMNDNPNPGPRGFAQPPLDEFYREQVIGGPGAFVIAIDEFESFAYAIVNKLIKEIADFAVDPSVRVAEAK
ncbi:MAG: DUF1194 domain-containing protein [Azospirillum sp.]|nr:DUF1194 domain-containing protein [Azospirillum sp.]MCA3268410.1 DUF1194 domain-containing protein [Azospirillum sp.]MCZ8122040.1 DUF1194 domain-containing protein [Magnetospirillum sp.]